MSEIDKGKSRAIYDALSLPEDPPPDYSISDGFDKKDDDKFNYGRGRGSGIIKVLGFFSDIDKKIRNSSHPQAVYQGYKTVLERLSSGEGENVAVYKFLLEVFNKLVPKAEAEEKIADENIECSQDLYGSFTGYNTAVNKPLCKPSTDYKPTKHRSLYPTFADKSDDRDLFGGLFGKSAFTDEGEDWLDELTFFDLMDDD